MIECVHTSTPIFSTETETKKKGIKITTSIPIDIRYPNTITFMIYTV